MNTQQRKNSLHLAAVSYRSRQRATHLKTALTAFFAALSIICTGLYIIISGIEM